MSQCKKCGTEKVMRTNKRGADYVVCPTCKPEGSSPTPAKPPEQKKKQQTAPPGSNSSYDVSSSGSWDPFDL